MFAFARDGMLPAALARVHPRFRTPWLAIIATPARRRAAVSSSSRSWRCSRTSRCSCCTCCVAGGGAAAKDVRAGGTPFSVPGDRDPGAALAVIVWICRTRRARIGGRSAGACRCVAALYGSARGRHRGFSGGERSLDRSLSTNFSAFRALRAVRRAPAAGRRASCREGAASAQSPATTRSISIDRSSSAPVDPSIAIGGQSRAPDDSSRRTAV